MTEVFYCWKEIADVEGETRLLTPWSDAMEYEQEFDLLFNTPEEARKGLIDWDVDPEESKDWVLCKRTLEVVED